MSADELPSEPTELVVPADQEGSRLDVFLAAQFPIYSRVHLRKVINAAGVKVEGKRTKAAHRLRAGDRIRIVLPDLPREGPLPEDIPLTVLYEDEQIAVIDKPPGMVVHPARGHWSGTLTSALAFHFEQLSTAGGAGRPGIVHRLDRDTSGVMVVAKNDRAHMLLAEQFEQRTTEKEYFAIVAGGPRWDRDVIDGPIGPHPYHREKMAIRRDYPASREAQTFYEVLERFRGYTAMRALPKTGRTHQIRLHLGHIGCPVLCDRLYGGRAQITRGEISGNSAETDILLHRQALHARRLKIAAPTAARRLNSWRSVPADLERVLEALRQQIGK